MIRNILLFSLFFIGLNFLHAEVINDSAKEDNKSVSIAYFFYKNGTPYFLSLDHLGNTRAVVSNNIVEAQYDYYPYGKILRKWENISSRYLSTGHEQDAETGYNARNARWQDADMLGFGQVDPMSDKYPSLSPYNYCNNTPILFSDPTGEDPDADRDGEIGERAMHNDGKYYSMTEKGWGGTTQNEAIVNSKKTNIGIPTDVAKIMETSDGAMYKSGAGYIWENYAKSVGQTNDYYIHQNGNWNYYQNYGNWNDRMWQGRVDMWESWANVMAQACVSMIPVSGVASSTFSRNVVMNVAEEGLTNAQLVQKAATLAERAIGGTGGVAGTAKHQYASKLLNRYQKIFGDRGLSPNHSFNNGVDNRGFLDVLDKTNGIIYDFKFGKAVMSSAQYNKYFNNFGLPIKIIRP